MFSLFPAISLGSQAPRWAAKTPQYSMVFGLSPFADLFVCSEAQTKFAIIATERPELIPLKFDTLSEFTGQLLTDGGMRKSFFREADYDALCARLGQLEADECFYAVPFRNLGGSGALETYQKGNVWVHLDLYGQSIGL